MKKMDEKVSEGEENMKTMSSLSSSSTNNQVWDQLEDNTDHLIYNCKGYEASTKYLNQYRQWLIAVRSSDVDVLEKLVSESGVLGKKFEEIGPHIETKITDTLTWLFRKIGWKPHNIPKNIGYAGYEDMLLRYRDLKKELDRMQVINKHASETLRRIKKEHRNMCQMNEKLEELNYRWNLLNVAKSVASRAESPNDSLSAVFSLPIFLTGTTFHAETSHSYASRLLRICKRILAVAEAIQYERNPRNDPIVTTSNVLTQPPQSRAVRSLYVPIQYADGNGEVLAPEDKIVPIARDSALTLNTSENGEVFAPEEKIIPIARDSAHTLVSSENGEVTATSEINMPVAKDSTTSLSSNESPKPLSRAKLASEAEKFNSKREKSHKNG